MQTPLRSPLYQHCFLRSTWSLQRAQYSEPLERVAARLVAAGPRLLSVWLAQYLEPPEGAVLRASRKGCGAPGRRLPRNFDGTFCKRVFPFDPFYFCTKVHPTGALLFTPHHSQLTFIQFQYAKNLFSFSQMFQNYWLEEDGAMSLDKDHRWRASKTLQNSWLVLSSSKHQGRNRGSGIQQIEAELPMKFCADVP